MQCHNELSSEYGVQQGDLLSPTLFRLFINDLATNIKIAGAGIKIDDDLHVKVLLYADDLAIISESEEDLQRMLQSLSKWCKNGV